MRGRRLRRAASATTAREHHPRRITRRSPGNKHGSSGPLVLGASAFPGQTSLCDGFLASARPGRGARVGSPGAARAGYDVPGRLRDLLARAQRAGSVRPEVDHADVKALLPGRDGDGATLDRIVAVVCDGLAAPS